MSTLSKGSNKIAISKQFERNSMEDATYTELVMQQAKIRFLDDPGNEFAQA
jgi:hypothetical protein